MSPRRAMSLGLVGILHVALIWALVTGLAQRFVKHLPPVLEATIVDQTTPQTKQMVAPKPEMVQPQEATVPPPDFQVQTDVAPPIQVAVAPTAPASPPVSAAASSINNTHTTPPYPEQARRAGVQGTVRLHISVTAQGTVSNATVVTSSGNPELDFNAVAWVIAHWKYKPALASGTPVASETEANVVYDLKHAR
jgi:protein TonB